MRPPLLQDSGLLVASGVSLQHGGRPILQRLDLQARPGRLLVLLGPNGAGKSSLLKLLAGVTVPSSGQVRLDGQALTEWSPSALARRRAMLSQQVQLDFDYRVEEVVALGCSPHGAASRPQERSLIEASLRAAQVAHLAQRDYLGLSGGERQRVQLARVLTQLAPRQPSAAPAWLLLDEPEAGLDIAQQHLVLTHAQRLARQGHGVVAVLHDLNLAARYADEVALLSAGQLQCHAAAAQVLEPGRLSQLYGLPLRRVDYADGWQLVPA